MGTRSELNWELEASYRGYGIGAQRNSVVTPYGVVFANKNGIYLYDGSIEPKELSKKIKSFLSANFSVGYDPINRRILAFQDSTWLWLIDLDDGFISRQTGVGSFSIISFDVYENNPHILDTTSDQVYNMNGTPTLINPNFATGLLSFGTYNNKRINRVKIRYLWASTGAPTVKLWATTKNESKSVDLPETGTDSGTVEFNPNVYGRYLKVSLTVASGVDTFEVSSIEISGKIYRI
jgi:hypothetical protein